MSYTLCTLLEEVFTWSPRGGRSSPVGVAVSSRRRVCRAGEKKNCTDEDTAASVPALPLVLSSDLVPKEARQDLDVWLVVVEGEW